MKRVFIMFCVASVCVNLILSIFIFSKSDQSPENSAVSFRDIYPYLSPRIFAQEKNDTIINFIPLREKIKQYTNGSKEKIGYYFEYLPSGISIGINEKENFIPASLLKVPMVMAAYKQIEEKKIDPKTILTVGEAEIDPIFGELWKNGVGTKISFEDSIKQTLVYSDNTAKNLILHALPDGAIEEVFDYLDIPRELENNVPVVTPKNYSSIIRSLYLSSFLETKNSNQILADLTQTVFRDRIVAGVPDHIQVAHKIGVYSPNQKNETYTDCGIVFVPKRPYILCIMIRSPLPVASEHMKQLSSLTYAYISKANIPGK